MGKIIDRSVEFSDISPSFSHPNMDGSLAQSYELLIQSPSFDITSLTPDQIMIVETESGFFSFCFKEPYEQKQFNGATIIESSIKDLEPGEVVRIDGASMGGSSVIPGQIRCYCPVSYIKVQDHELSEENFPDLNDQYSQYYDKYIEMLRDRGKIKTREDGSQYATLWDGYWRYTAAVTQAFLVQDGSEPKQIFH